MLAPAFADVANELYARQDVLGDALMGALAEALGLAPDTFRDMFRGGGEGGQGDGGGEFGTIRLLHYPATEGEPDPDVDRGIAAHTDFEFFTLMEQDAPGLQFLPPPPETSPDADDDDDDDIQRLPQK